jgi:hypothetical protein
MTLLQDITAYAESIPAVLKENKSVYEISFVVAERKTFLNRQKLEYKAKFRVDDKERIVKYTEMLKESGYGVSTGNPTPGFGFKKETYNTLRKAREGVIEEQSEFFGKKYDYRFDYKTVREKIKELAQQAGYDFKYQVTSIGL